MLSTVLSRPTPCAPVSRVCPDHIHIHTSPIYVDDSDSEDAQDGDDHDDNNKEDDDEDDSA